jgi:predicted ATPase
LPSDHRLRRFLAERLRAGDATHVQLGRLDRRAVAQLVTAAGLDGSIHRAGERLYEETEGLPFFVTQYLIAASMTDADRDWRVPQTVRDLLRERVAGVGDADRQLLTAAAVIGRSFSFDALRDASGRNEDETVAAIERLLAGGFFRVASEVGDNSRYDFNHERLRAYVYEEASPARRRLLHRRVAEALARDRRNARALAGSIGLHYQLAGHDEEAALHFEAAGRHARGLHANVEALAHFRAALASRHPEPGRLHGEIGDLLTLAGEYGPALASYQTAAALASSDYLPAIEHKVGLLYLRLGAWELAEEHLAAALDGFSHDGDRARILADRSLAAHRAGRDGDATALAERSLRLAESAGDQHAMAQSHNILGMLAASRGNNALALQHLDRSRVIAERLDDIEARIAALNNLALAKSEDEPAEAEPLLRAALELCIVYGDHHREAALRNNLADLLRILGDVDESMTQLKQAVSTFAEIGADREDSEPEIWKLVNW